MMEVLPLFTDLIFKSSKNQNNRRKNRFNPFITRFLCRNNKNNTIRRFITTHLHLSRILCSVE